MLLMILFWVILVLTAFGGGWYFRTQPWAPAAGPILVLLALLGWKVFPPG